MAKNTVKSVDRALKILCLLGESKEPLTIRNLSQLLDLPRTTLYATINSLEHLGFVARNEDTKTIDIGWRLYALGLVFLQNQLDPLISEEARKLCRKWNQIVHVAKYVGNNRIVFLIAEVPDWPYMVTPRLGFITNAHFSASGKVLLAHLSKDELQWIHSPGALEQRTPNTITDPDQLLSELAIIKKQGWAIDNEESNMGIACVAAPIKNTFGECVASISISGSKNDLFAHLDAMRDDVISVARFIASSSKLHF